MLNIENYGFDTDIFMIVQLHGTYQDFSILSPTNPYSYIYSVFFGTTFYIPSYYDILIYFHPTYSFDLTVSSSGKIIVRT